MGCDKMVSEHFDPRQQMVWSDSVGWYTPARIPNPCRSLAAHRPSSLSGYGGGPYRCMAKADRPSSLSGYGGGPYRQEMGVIGLGSSACKIPSRFQSESALEPYLPRQIPDSSDLRRRRGPTELALAVSGPDRHELKVPHSTPGKIPNSSSDLGKMKEWVVSYEEDASDPTAIWRVISATNYKAVVGQHQLGKLEKTRRSEDLRQINPSSTQGIQPVGAPEGNLNSHLAGFSVVVSGWGQDPLPCSLASSTGNHQNLSQELTSDRQWLQNPKENLSQPHSQYQAKQWDSNPSNKRVLSVSTVDDDLSYSNNMKIEQMEQTKVKAKLCFVEYQPRRVPGKEILEQEVYGIDPYTLNIPKEIVPADLDWSIDDKAEEKKGVNVFGDEGKINKDIAVKTNSVMANVPDEAKFYLTQLYMVGRDGRLLRSMGLLWNLPPWPDLSFCEVHWRAMGMEKGVGAVSRRNAYNMVARQGKNLFQPTREKQLTDFVKEWVARVEQYKLKDNEWFSALYSCRKQWAPGYVNHSCWAGISAIREVDYTEVYNNADKVVWCICRSFRQSPTAYCSRAFAVLKQEKVLMLTSKYLLNRWKKDFRILHASTCSSSVASGRGLGIYDDFYVCGHEYLEDIIYIGAREHELEEFLLSVMKEVKDIGFTGASRLIFRPLVDELTCFGAVCFSLSHKKQLDFRLWVIGGEISVIPGNSDTLEETIKNAIEDSITWSVRKVIPIIPGDYRGLELKSVGIVEVNLGQARDLTNKDVIGKSDPFAILYVSPLPDQTKRSQTINKYADTHSVTVKIYDGDRIQGSELIGCVQFVLNDLQKGKVKDVWLKLVQDLEIQRDRKNWGQEHLELLYCPSEMKDEAYTVERDVCPVAEGAVQGHALSVVTYKQPEVDGLKGLDVVEVKVGECEIEADQNCNIIVDLKRLSETTHQASCAPIDINSPESTGDPRNSDDVNQMDMHGNGAMASSTEQVVSVHLEISSSLHFVEVIPSSQAFEGTCTENSRVEGSLHHTLENALGGIYGILDQKRGHVFEEMQSPGTPLYNIKALMKRVMQIWLPASNALLVRMIFHLPSPLKTQKHHVDNLYEGPLDDIYVTAIKHWDPGGYLMLDVPRMSPASDKGRFYAFGCVFSEKFAIGMKGCIMGPNYVLGQKKDLYEKEIEPALKKQLIISTAQKEVTNWGLFFCVAIGLWAGLIRTMKSSVSPRVRIAVQCLSSSQAC